jgi:molecular chaperone GrpE
MPELEAELKLLENPGAEPGPESGPESEPRPVAAQVEAPVSEKLAEPAPLPVSEVAGTPEDAASREQPVSPEESLRIEVEPVAAMKESVSEAPREAEPSAEPETHMSLKQLVSALESDETGAVTIAALEEPASEGSREPEPLPDPEQAATPEEPEGPAELDLLKAERDKLLDRLARLQADFENARKRAERERAADRDYATGSVVEKFLPVVDNFELALKSSGTAEQLRSGVELIVKQMEDALRQLQVTPIPALGAEFDPRYHEALGSVERLDLPDQHVAEEIRRGYKLRDKLLRPALVRVASNPKQTNE